MLRGSFALRVLIGGIASDYAELYRDRGESKTQQRRYAVRRFCLDPSLHAAVLVRLRTEAPGAAAAAAGWLLRRKHGMVIARTAEFGRGIRFDHPLSIVVGPRTKVGRGVRLYHGTMVGSPQQGDSEIGDGAIIFCYSRVAPGVRVGPGAMVGANTEVTADLPACWVATRGGRRPLRQD